PPRCDDRRDPTRRRRNSRRSKSRRAVVAPSRRERGRVKSVNGRAIGSTKADMCAGNWCLHLGFAGDVEFNPYRPRCGTVIGTSALAEIDDAYEAEGRSTASQKWRLRSTSVISNDT